MYRALLVVFVTSSVYTAPLTEDGQAKITEYEYTNDGQGIYSYRFETSNGITRQENGRLKNVGQPDEHIYVEGSYSYIDPDGVTQTVDYIADENGFQIITRPEITVVPVTRPPVVAFSQRALSSAVVATLLG